MITTLAEVETNTINDWHDFFKSFATEFTMSYSGIVPVQSPDNPVRYSLPNYNIHRSTIVASDSTSVIQYRPLENDTMVSDVIMAAPLAVGTTFSYIANTVSFVTRETPAALLKTPLYNPRLFILNSQNIQLKGHRQVNDNGLRVIPRKIFMNLLVDTDDKTGLIAGTTGPLQKNQLAGLVEQALQKPENLLWLYEQGYEDIRIQRINFFSPEEEKRIGVYRAMIMVTMNVYPLPF